MGSRSTLTALAALLVVTAPAIGASPRGAVASSDPRATAAGIAMLESDGNAVDAAVATALALAVVFPEAGNLGGGGFAVVRVGGVVHALDFREVAPASARPDMFLDAAGNPVSGASLYGPLATGVPGSPAGYHELQRRYGKLPWKRVVAPAIALARDGFALSARSAKTLAEKRDVLARFPEARREFLPGGIPRARRRPQVTARAPAGGARAVTCGLRRARARCARPRRRRGGDRARGPERGWRPDRRRPRRLSPGLA